MAEMPTKEDLLARLRATRAAWETEFNAIPRERLQAPDAVGSWSARDVQAHITTNNRWMAGQLRALVRGDLPTAEECYGHEQVPPPGTNLADQDSRNAWWHSIDRKRPLDEVLNDAPRVADALEAAIAAVPDAEMAQGYTFGDHRHIAQVRRAREGEPAWPLGSIIASYADEHYISHTTDLRTARQGGVFDAATA